MTMVKRSVVLLLLLAMSLPAVFAAGDAEGSSADDEVTLLIRFIGPGKQKDAEMVWEEFNKQLPNYLPGTQVEFEIVTAADYADRWKLTLAAGEQLDLAGRYWMQNLDVEAAKGAFLPLDDLIDEYGPDIKKNLPDWVLQKGMTQGQIYEIPCYQIMTAMRYSLFTHADLAERYDLDEIADAIEPKEFMDAESWNMLEEFFVQSKEDGDLRKGPSTTLSWLYQKGLDWIGQGAAYEFNADPVVVFNRYEHPSYRLMIERMAEWYEMDLIRKDVLAMDNPRVDDGKQDGTTMYVHSFWGTEAANDLATSERWGFPWVVRPVQRDSRVSYAHSATNVAIPSTAKYPERSMQYINLMNSEEGSDLFNMLTWGLEGTHYTVVRDATGDLPKRIETIGYAGQGNSDSPYGLWKWAMGNTAFSWLTQADTDEYINSWVTANETASPSPLMGFVPNPEPTRTEEAQIQAVVGEFATTLEYGALGDDWLATYEDFLAKLKAAGIDKVVAEYQSQVDAFLADQ